jgi:NAD(P)H-quinone oxidoreductase subunit 5
VLWQILGPALPQQENMARLAVHFRHGFYANACFDRLVGALKLERKPRGLLRSLRSKVNAQTSDEQRESMAS